MQKNYLSNVDYLSCNKDKVKVADVTDDILRKFIPNYDYILLEGDGAKRLPLKGWAEWEPCIPGFTTLVIGVVSGCSLGKKTDENLIHRLEIFNKTINRNGNKYFDRDLLTEYIERGSFLKGFKGRKIIY